MVENWIDVFRDIKLLRTATMWGQQTATNDHLFAGTVLTRLPLSNALRVPNVYGTVTEFDYVYRLAKRKEPTYPNFMMVRNGRHGRTSEVETFRFGSLAFMWGNWDPNSPTGYQLFFDTDNNQAGFPSVVEVKGAAMHMVDEVLDGERAFIASNMYATWTDRKGNLRRSDGPHMIGFRGYEEDWDNGAYMGYTICDNGPLYQFAKTQHESQERSEFIGRRSGELDPLSNQFFVNPVDQFEYLTEFSFE